MLIDGNTADLLILTLERTGPEGLAREKVIAYREHPTTRNRIAAEVAVSQLSSPMLETIRQHTRL